MRCCGSSSPTLVKLLAYKFLDRTRTEGKPEAKTTPKTQAKIDTKPEAADDPMSDAKAQPVPDAEAETKPDATAQPAHEAKAETKPDAKAQPAPEANPDTKAEVDGEAKAGIQSEVTLQLVERVHALYEELGREVVQAVQESGKAPAVLLEDEAPK